jgi:hypothetical protein
MRRASFLPVLVFAALAPPGAFAQTCEEEVGPDLAAIYVEQCLEVSPATHPPCNVENSCELIQDELARGCALLTSDSPELVPDYCAEYLGSE